MNMELTTDTEHQQQEVNAFSSSSFFLSSSQELNNSGISYANGENCGFGSGLSVMPLKSDGSCLIEAFSRSNSVGVMPDSSPKLENFLGGTTSENGSHHQYIHQELYNLTESKNNSQFFQQILQNGLGIGPNQHMNSMLSHFGLMGGPSDLQTLTLSMNPEIMTQSSSVTVPNQASSALNDDYAATELKKRGFCKLGQNQKQIVHRKSIENFGQRTSQYRGVTRHRWTGRYEAHLWDNSVKKEGQTRKGRQVYLGGYDMEEKAARSYDLAALKYWGPSTHLNFPFENYRQELEDMKNMTRQEYVARLRRKSSGFSRGASIYRGVTRHHQHGRWQARIGRVAGNKDLYLGTFNTQEEAAEAYDIAAIKFRGANTVTNFDAKKYDVEKIMTSNHLLNAETARRRNAETEQDPTESNLSTIYQNHHQAVNFSEIKRARTQFSNESSSLVTNLSGSREVSPDQSGSITAFDTNNQSGNSKFLDSGFSSSWFPSVQLKPETLVSSVSGSVTRFGNQVR